MNQIAWLVVVLAIIYFASTIDWATATCFFEHHENGPKPSKKKIWYAFYVIFAANQSLFV